MKKVFKISWFTLCTLIIIAFLISSASAFIAPSAFSFISIFAILFPYLFLLMIVIVLINFFIQKKLALFMLLCILIFGYRNVTNSFAFNSGDWENKKDSSTLRIMTWNVEGFVNMLAQNYPEAAVRIKMLKTIQQLNPDILCVQEFKNAEHARWLMSVRHELDSIGYPFYYCSNDKEVHLDNGAVHTNGVAIFSKIPVADTGRRNIIRYDGEDENLIYADIMLKNKPLRIFTAHLLSFSLFPDTAASADEGKNIYKQAYDRKRSILYKLRDIESIHEKEVKIIRSEIDKSPYPAIYCGDMNTTPASYNFRFLKANLQDAFIEKGYGIGNTFYKIAPTLRIDVCFADDKLKVLQCKVEKRKLSDHYPVITDLQWK